jgi:hypothetical protein
MIEDRIIPIYFFLVSGLAASRALSIKRCATGLGARFLRVMTLVVPRIV